MANHMKEVASMLDVEFGEYFEIRGCSGLYVFCADGLYHAESGFKCESILANLLSGVHSIKRTPWKPAFHEAYYSIGPGGALEPGTWMNDFIDCMLYKLGNCYPTPQEAEANKGKWATFYSSDNIVEV